MIVLWNTIYMEAVLEQLGCGTARPVVWEGGERKLPLPDRPAAGDLRQMIWNWRHLAVRCSPIRLSFRRRILWQMHPS